MESDTHIMDKIECLICCGKVPVPNSSGPSNESSVSEVLVDLFRVLAHYMDWDESKQESERKKYEFNFKQDLFPFCESCKRTLIQMYKMNQDVNCLLEKLHKAVATLSAKIIISEENKMRGGEEKGEAVATLGLISTSYDLNCNKYDVISCQQIRRRKCLEKKIRHYRYRTIQKYDTMIDLTKDKAAVGEWRRKMKNAARVQKNKGQQQSKATSPTTKSEDNSKNLPLRNSGRGNKKKKKGFQGKQSNFDNRAENGKFKKAENNNGALKEVEAHYKCDNCNQTYKLKHSLEKHQAMICGRPKKEKDSVVKVSRGRCFYRQYPFEAKNGSLQCGTCESVFTNLEGIKRHIVRVHISKGKSDSKSSRKKSKTKVQTVPIPASAASTIDPAELEIEQPKKPEQIICVLCSATFGKMNDLYSHMASVHLEILGGGARDSSQSQVESEVLKDDQDWQDRSIDSSVAPDSNNNRTTEEDDGTDLIALAPPDPDELPWTGTEDEAGVQDDCDWSPENPLVVVEPFPVIHSEWMDLDYMFEVEVS